MKSNRWFLGFIFSNMAGGIINPMIPLFVVVYLGSNVFYVSLASALSSLVSVPALIFWGELSDSLGKRKLFILYGFYGSFLSLMLIIFVHSVYSFILVLIIYQVVLNASVPVSTLIILEQNNPEEWPRIISRFSLLSGIGSLLGLIVGMIFLLDLSKSSDLPYIYIISSLLYLIAAIVSTLILKESEKKIRREEIKVTTTRTLERIIFSPRGILHILKFSGLRKYLSKNLLFFILTTFFLMFAFQTFFVPFPVMVIKHLGASNIEIFIMYAVNVGLSTIGYVYTGRIMEKLGGKRTLKTALTIRIFLFAFSAIIPLIFSGFSGIAVSMIIYGVLGFLWSWIGISQINYVSRSAGEGNRGRAVGLYNSMLGLGQVAGSLFSGYITTMFGYSLDFVLSAILVLFGLILVNRIYSEKIAP